MSNETDPWTTPGPVYISGGPLDGEALGREVEFKAADDGLVEHVEIRTEINALVDLKNVTIKQRHNLPLIMTPFGVRASWADRELVGSEMVGVR